ncbi:cilia- and flagella-associated protein 251 [Mugil cephalus]|uniref:cilia- and flagella-associated protein 251 n=1 Tax=Mugil cephalus TaxID=48193 RepID=UPI001FB79D90|nr:cilia- and flagella-associated protein 251 [Mugil cephalus]
MTIGKRQSSVRSSIRAPKFLDKSSGFYGRLDEPEVAQEVEENGMCDTSSPSLSSNSGAEEREEVEVFDFNEGLMEDDGETLLHRKSSRRSSRWRRSSRRKQKEGRAEEEQAREERPSLGTESPVEDPVPEDGFVKMEEEEEEEESEKTGTAKEPALVHFPVREDGDDQVLIRDKKRGREEEGEEERKMKKEQEQGMKMVKRKTVKTYRKALDRAFRRGWEAFITNLYSVTLAPDASSSPPSSSPSTKRKHNSVLAEFQ